MNNNKTEIDYTDLYNQSIDKINFAKRDLNELKPYGITANYLSTLRSVAEIFEERNPRLSIKPNIKNLITKRNKLANRLRNEMGEIESMAYLAFGNYTPEFQKFQVNRFDVKNDIRLIFRVSKFIENVEFYFEYLEVYGLTSELLNTIMNVRYDFIETLETLQNLQKNSLETQENVEVFHQNLMNLCKIGKSAMANDFLMFEDYVLHYVPKVTEIHTDIDKQIDSDTEETIAKAA